MQGLVLSMTSLGLACIIQASAAAQAEHGSPREPSVTAPRTSAETSDPDTPRIVCEEPVYQFPATWAGDVIQHVFIIKNEGKGDLEITHVKPACGCTIAGVYDKHIAPGATGKLPVVLQTHRFNGVITKYISISSNDPANQVLSVSLTGQVRPRIHIQPGTLMNWSRVRPGSDLTRKVTLINNTDIPLQCKPTGQGANSIFQWELREIDPGKKLELLITPQPPFPDGISKAHLQFQTGIPAEATVDITCRLYQPPVVEVRPKWVTIISPVHKKNHVRFVNLYYNGPDRFEIETTESSTEGITVHVQEVRPAQHYRITLHFRQGLEIAEDKPETLTIRTNVKKYGNIAIAIRGRKRRTAAPPKDPDTTHPKPGAKQATGQSAS